MIRPPPPPCRPTADSPIKTFLASARGEWPDIEEDQNAETAVVEYEGGNFRIAKEFS
jgi:hypothetical protein